jgi:hypothetical protein
VAQVLAVYKYGFNADRPWGDAEESAVEVCRATRRMTGELVDGETYATAKVENDEHKQEGKYLVRVEVLKPEGKKQL